MIKLKFGEFGTGELNNLLDAVKWAIKITFDGSFVFDISVNKLIET